MDIIRNANILDEEDLLLLETHNLKAKYSIIVTSTKVTRLMLLINLISKYPTLINIIEQYVKKTETSLKLNEINNYDSNEWSALDLCILKGTKIIKILLDNGANINMQDSKGNTCLCIALLYNLSMIQLILEYDAINIKRFNGTYQDSECSDEKRSKFNKLCQSIALLNAKN